MQKNTATFFFLFNVKKLWLHNSIDCIKTGNVLLHLPFSHFLFTFSYPYMVEKVLFLGQIFEMGILMDLHAIRTSESDNYIFSAWFVCLCICDQHNSKTICCRNIRYSILHLYRIQIDKNSTYRDAQKNSNTLRSTGGISC